MKICMLIPLVVAISGCAAESVRPNLIKDICSVGVYRPNTMSSYINVSGSVVQGDISSRVEYKGSEFSTALAGTDRGKVYVSRGSVCTGMYPNGMMYTYPCMSEEEIDLDSVYGLGRALNKEQAEELALENCERILADTAKNKGFSKRRIKCKILHSQNCY